MLGIATSASASAELEYRWSETHYENNEKVTTVVKDWTRGNEWLDWEPAVFGEYTVTGEVRVVHNPSSAMTCDITFQFNPYIIGSCQIPYYFVEDSGEGILIGVETYENPNQSYQYEMLILDCTLLKQGLPAWIYTTGKYTVDEGCAGWTVWQPEYGYYWTLFRVYDENGNMLDQVCYGFANTY